MHIHIHTYGQLTTIHMYTLECTCMYSHLPMCLHSCTYIELILYTTIPTSIVSHKQKHLHPRENLEGMLIFLVNFVSSGTRYLMANAYKLFWYRKIWENIGQCSRITKCKIHLKVGRITLEPRCYKENKAENKFMYGIKILADIIAVLPAGCYLSSCSLVSNWRSISHWV